MPLKLDFFKKTKTLKLRIFMLIISINPFIILATHQGAFSSHVYVVWAPTKVRRVKSVTFCYPYSIQKNLTKLLIINDFKNY